MIIPRKKTILLTLILVIIGLNIALSCFAYNVADVSQIAEQTGLFAKLKHFSATLWTQFQIYMEKAVNWSKNSVRRAGEWLKQRPNVIKQSWQEEKIEWRETLDKYFKR